MGLYLVTMRIGVLTHNYPRYPGDFMGHFVQSLCEELARQGSHVTVIAPFDADFRRPMSAQFGAGSVQVRLYRYALRSDQHIIGYGRSMEADVNLRRSHSLLSPLMLAAGTASTLAWARRARPDVLHAHWALPNGLMAATVGKLLGIPVAVSIPGSDATVADSNALFRAMARFTFSQAGLITANSNSLKGVAVERLGADPARFDLIPYGVNPDTNVPDTTGVADLRATLGIPEDAVVLLAVGRMVYKKGFDQLIKALPLVTSLPTRKPLPPIHAVLVGQGDLWQTWQDLAVQMGVSDHVHWVGNVPFDQIQVYYNMADVAVMPAVTRPADGLNVTVLDAMSCAKPIIGSDAAGNTLAVADGVNGLIVPEQDDLALAQAIVRLAEDADLRQRMGAAGRHRIETELGWPQLAWRYLDHFERMGSNGR